MKPGALDNEIMFRTSRSSGPGGQHVNKVSTRVELRFSIDDSRVITSREKEVLQAKLSSRINKDGIMYLSGDSFRSQLKNREQVRARFYSLIHKALAPVKRRTRTRPPRSANQKRLEDKRLLAQKKSNRKKIDF